VTLGITYGRGTGKYTPPANRQSPIDRLVGQDYWGPTNQQRTAYLLGVYVFLFRDCTVLFFWQVSYPSG